MSFFDYIYHYFVDPILRNGWFNPINTTVYAIILAVAVYLVFKMLKRMNIKIDNHFFLAVLPFIYWGSTTRVLHDAAYKGILSSDLNHFYNSPIFPTPGSYIITFTLAVFVLLLSLVAQKRIKIPYWKFMLSIGICLDVINTVLLPFKSIFPLIFIISIALIFFSPFLILRIFSKRKIFLKKLFPAKNLGIIFSHLLDASATVTALSLYGYLEQHVVPRFFISIFGPVCMFPLKVAVVLPALWIIDKYTDDKNFKNFLKLVILILGLAPGLRDTIRLMVGV